MRLSEARAKAVILKWAKILGINPLYRYKLKINNAPDPDVKKSERKDVQAFVETDQAYYYIHLTINAYEFEEEDLEHVIVHELVHVVLGPLSTIAREAYTDKFETTCTNLIESTTEQIAQALMNATRRRKGTR